MAFIREYFLSILYVVVGISLLIYKLTFAHIDIPKDSEKELISGHFRSYQVNNLGVYFNIGSSKYYFLYASRLGQSGLDNLEMILSNANKNDVFEVLVKKDSVKEPVIDDKSYRYIFGLKVNGNEVLIYDDLVEQWKNNSRIEWILVISCLFVLYGLFPMVRSKQRSKNTH